MSLRPRAPAPCAAAACCASSPSFGADRLAAVLAAGMRLGATPPAPTGVVLESQDRLAQCAICLEPMFSEVSEDNPFIILNCDHAFHVDCLATWVQRSSGCPTCRKTITQTDKDDINKYALSTTSDGIVFRNGRRVRIELPDDEKWFYEGGKGAERLVRVEFNDGEKQFFEGEQGYERLVRIEDLNGLTQFYEGESGAERKVRTELPDGEKRFYEGEQGAERRVRMEQPDGWNYFFEGEQDAERLVRIELPDGEKWFFEGEKGAERRVQVEPESRLDNARAKRLRTRALVGRSGPTL